MEKEVPPAEVMQHLLQSLSQLAGQVGATEIALQSLLRALPAEQAARFATDFRGSIDGFLQPTMDHPGGMRTLPHLSRAANAYLEAARRPGEPPPAQ